MIGVCGLVENMPDGKAQRPGDVVTTMSVRRSKSSTRCRRALVLGDALTWAQREFKPAAIVDLATLTGAMIIALGHEHGGLFANDDALAERLLSAGRTSGDKLWRFPLSPAYDKLIDSPIADIRNVGPRWGPRSPPPSTSSGSSKRHPLGPLDIAGMSGRTAWCHLDKGATGYGVR